MSTTVLTGEQKNNSKSKVISMFNHKGGVGKTTNVFNIACMLADKGKKILLIDADSQCNLTGLALFKEWDSEAIEKFYTSKEPNNIYNALVDFFVAKKIDISAASITPVPANPDNLFILAGHVNISEFESQLAVAIKTSESLARLGPIVGMFHQLIEITAKKYEIDYVFIDMGPSISSTNMCLLLGSDFLIVPLAPDYFSHQSIDSLAKVLPLWQQDMLKFKKSGILPAHNPKFAGIIYQNYRVYASEKAAAFQQWEKRINTTIENVLIPRLKESSMTLDTENYSPDDEQKTYIIGNVKDFNSLLPHSQALGLPLYALKDKGANLGGAIHNVEVAGDVYNKIAEKILEL